MKRKLAKRNKNKITSLLKKKSYTLGEIKQLIKSYSEYRMLSRMRKRLVPGNVSESSEVNKKNMGNWRLVPLINPRSGFTHGYTLKELD